MSCSSLSKWNSSALLIVAKCNVNKILFYLKLNWIERFNRKSNTVRVFNISNLFKSEIGLSVRFFSNANLKANILVVKQRFLC